MFNRLILQYSMTRCLRMLNYYIGINNQRKNGNIGVFSGVKYNTEYIINIYNISIYIKFNVCLFQQPQQ
jgi:hypothetical protein